MQPTNDTETYANDSATSSSINTGLAQSGSRDVLRRDLIAIRVKHGSTSAIGSHCSNIVELIQMPNPPADLLKRQMDGLQRLLA